GGGGAGGGRGRGGGAGGGRFAAAARRGGPFAVGVGAPASGRGVVPACSAPSFACGKRDVGIGQPVAVAIGVRQPFVDRVGIVQTIRPATGHRIPPSGSRSPDCDSGPPVRLPTG